MVCSHPTETQDQWKKAVKENHTPVDKEVGTDDPVDELEPFCGLATVERFEGVENVGIGHQQARRQKQFCKYLDVPLGDKRRQIQWATKGKHKQQHGRQPGPQRSEHKERRILRRMPAGRCTTREVQSDDRMNGNHERSHDRGQHPVGRLEVPPLHATAAEAHCKYTVGHLSEPAARAVAHRCQVRHNAEIPEQDGGDDVC
jgi:hypothetical protein